MNTTYRLLAMTIILLNFSCQHDRGPASDDNSFAESAKRPKNGGGSTTPSPTPTPTPATTSGVRGLRVDPAYFYNSNSGQSVTQVAQQVVANAKNAGATQLYLYAYNTIYGAWYPTTYSNTIVENGYGKLNIFNAVTTEAKNQGLKVIAVVPLNNFKTVWDNNPTWRVKKSGNLDYTPTTGVYLLSASVIEYQNWLKGFVDDLVRLNPNIDGVEAVEPTLDYHWDKQPDQNSSALQAFSTKYPGASIGSQSWLDFRSSEFLNLISIFNQQVHKNLKTSYLVQTWTIKSDGTLMDNSTIKNSSGFDFVGVATLQNESKTDNLITEFIWQQWFSEYGNTSISPTWISTIGASYINTLLSAGATSGLHIHCEISTFSGAYNTTTPSLTEFQTNLQSAKGLGIGISVYDYNQILTRSAFSYLGGWL